jgi:hypothetical protein
MTPLHTTVTGPRRAAADSCRCLAGCRRSRATARAPLGTDQNMTLGIFRLMSLLSSY